MKEPLPSSSEHTLPPTIIPGQAPTALAPMQDVTHLAFMSILHRYGSPDYYVTEYFRVHEHSRLEEHILASITKNPSDRPVFAQLIGENTDYIERTIQALKPYPIAGIDLNMGCPAPKIYKKNVGAGLLRDLPKIDRLLGSMREQIDGLFTVKMRVGFDSTDSFDALLELINKHHIDLLSLHGRTAKEMYRGDVHYDLIKQAAESIHCPVIANGNITSARKASEVLNYTQCHGVMIGRAAIRNPWIFRQIREHLSGEPEYMPKLEDVRTYVDTLYHATAKPSLTPRRHVAALKKFLIFIAQGVDAEGAFMHDIRRASDPQNLLQICDRHLLGEQANKAFPPEPYAGLIARPNCE